MLDACCLQALYYREGMKALPFTEGTAGLGRWDGFGRVLRGVNARLGTGSLHVAI